MDLENKLNPAVSRRGFVGAAAAGAAALGLAACGNTGSDTKGSAAGSSSSSVEEIVADKDGFVVKAEKTDPQERVRHRARGRDPEHAPHELVRRQLRQRRVLHLRFPVCVRRGLQPHPEGCRLL